MLKTSPVLTSSASASPTSFRHAHGPVSDKTPAAATGPIPRRPSSRPSSSANASMKSPVTPRSRRNIGEHVDASAMDAAASSSGQQESSNSASHEPPPSPRPQPMEASAVITRTTQAAQPPAPVAPPESQVQAVLSPNKRRGSLAQETARNALSESATASGYSSPKTSKRVKPDERPPKTLPKRYEFCAVEDMVELISHMLAELIATNDAIQMSNGGLTRFHSRTAPGISVNDYLHRLAKHATLTPPLLLAMVYYIDRLCLMYQEFTINTLTVHRFLITAATVAAKGLSDAFWNNATYARVGGVRLAELKLLELEFLHRVDWKIVPNPEVLVAYYRGLVERTPGYILESDGSSDEEIDEDSEEQDEGSE